MRRLSRSSLSFLVRPTPTGGLPINVQGIGSCESKISASPVYTDDRQAG